MEVHDHIEALGREGALLVAAARRCDLDGAVPACPGWKVRDLLVHIAFVHRWATAYVAKALAEMVEEPDEAELLESGPPDGELVDAVESGHAALVRALSEAPPDLDCWTFLPAPSPLAMWARRQAHETAIHRIDAELAAGVPLTAMAPEFAADGIDELLLAFLGRSREPVELTDAPGDAILVETRDPVRRWTVTTEGEQLTTRAGGGSAALVVRGVAQDLYLMLWNRRDTEGLEAEGNAALLERWREQVRVRWS